VLCSEHLILCDEDDNTVVEEILELGYSTRGWRGFAFPIAPEGQHMMSKL